MSIAGKKQKRLNYVVVELDGIKVDVDAAAVMAQRVFKPIDRSVRTSSAGWVDPLNTSETPERVTRSTFDYNDVLYGCQRFDSLDIPPSAMKLECAARGKQWLEEHSDAKRLPREAKRLIKEAVAHDLAENAIAKTTLVEVVVDVAKGMARVFSSSKKLCEELADELCSIAEVTRLMTYPSLAAVDAGGEGKGLFRVGEDGQEYEALEHTSKWLGREFLTWLAFMSDRGDGTIRVDIDGGEAEIQFFPTGSVTLADNFGRVVTVRDPEAIGCKETTQALKEGLLVDKMGFALEHGSVRYEGKLGSFYFGARGLKLPVLVFSDEVGEDAALRGNLMQLDKLDDIHLGLFTDFMSLREDSEAWRDEREAMKDWAER